ncbi:osteoclast-stimulating factor 1 [Passer montanus]|uniref:osteoclast-stimulating factor 1 n=1 Tax=Passer montanus TaxID=9160 RepID=UPI00195F4E89|nr:osteoclast-stimulating factor 1 [Passer montanus]
MLTSYKFLKKSTITSSSTNNIKKTRAYRGNAARTGPPKAHRTRTGNVSHSYGPTQRRCRRVSAAPPPAPPVPPLQRLRSSHLTSTTPRGCWQHVLPPARLRAGGAPASYVPSRSCAGRARPRAGAVPRTRRPSRRPGSSPLAAARAGPARSETEREAAGPRPAARADWPRAARRRGSSGGRRGREGPAGTRLSSRLLLPLPRRARGCRGSHRRLSPRPRARAADRRRTAAPSVLRPAMSKPPPKPAKPGQVKVFRALYTFEPRTPDELYFEEGDIIYISDMSDTNWWKGTCKGRTGLIPSNYVAEQAESIDNPLHEAAKRGNLSWLRECLDNRVGVNGLDKAGNTALYWACHGGHKDVVDVLLTQANLELNQQNKLGDTALHAAAWKGYADIVEMLLEKGARTDLKNNEKKLALDMATNAACASLLKKKQSAGTVRTLSNAEEYLDDEDSD